jgi:hypothetical protein
MKEIQIKHPKHWVDHRIFIWIIIVLIYQHPSLQLLWGKTIQRGVTVMIPEDFCVVPSIRRNARNE